MFTTSEYLRDYKPALFNAVAGKRDTQEFMSRNPERADIWEGRCEEWDYRAKEWAGIIIGRHC